MPEPPSLLAYFEAASNAEPSAAWTSRVKRTPFINLIRGFWHIVLLQVWIVRSAAMMQIGRPEDIQQVGAETHA